MEFLSTPSARRATAAYLLRLAESRYFYPRPPRGGRQVTSHKKIRGSGISIHALREEGDDPVPTNECLYDDFYPRPPRGGRHGLGGLNPVGTRFLSTPSARRATYPRCSPCGWSAISIHALREEGDSGSAASKTTRKTFLSTPSARRATVDLQRVKPHAKHFYPRPPRGGRLRSHKRYPCPEQNFYPRPPRGGRPPAGVLARWSIRFLSTPSARRATADMAESMLAEQFLSTPSARRATAKTETKSLFSNKLYNILHEFRRALIYNGSKNYPNHAK